MKFSVLMSVYAKEKPEFLSDAINSVLNQTLVPAEIVIVEDGPLTSGLTAVINNFQKQYPGIIKLVRLRTNSGLGTALNVGIRHCIYEYVARMDSDDISLPDRFEKQFNVMALHPEIDVLGAHIEEYDSRMKVPIGMRKVPISNNAIHKVLPSRNPFNHVAVVFKNRSVRAAGGYADMPYFEDYFLWCKLASTKSKFQNVDEVLLYVRGGREMHRRRGGLKYLGYTWRFQRKIHEMKIINRKKMIMNLAARSFQALAPNYIRGKMYQHILRSRT